ncbi:MAG TPA: hypothetical protein VNG71_17565, partial [Pyrinomonadaceae bacterium]|nr:hypothetical protein [Pyrinomonadaceae bacterium]
MIISECLPVFPHADRGENCFPAVIAREELQILSQSQVLCVAIKRWLGSKCLRARVRTGSGSDRIKSHRYIPIDPVATARGSDTSKDGLAQFFDGFRPILAQQTRECAISEKLAARLT